ncbi:hypothetical protein IMCC1989_1581 [gamma proteobacterium IMCC1989]|nr:hypothetical protein IMCC1989_1581 [gamma proteobacterium IMCC1989]
MWQEVLEKELEKMLDKVLKSTVNDPISESRALFFTRVRNSI